MKSAQQHSFGFTNWGGKRRGAGRKLIARRRSVEHRMRPKVAPRYPQHITLRLEPNLESLRRRRTYSVVCDARARACSRFGLRIVHYSVMTNHLHLICETDDERALTRGIKGLCVRLARNLNTLWQRVGRVIADRYHAHALKTPREVRNALAYLLHNARHHLIAIADPDPYSSARWFDGWNHALPTPAASSPLPPVRTWLLHIGWRRHGLIALLT